MASITRRMGDVAPYFRQATLAELCTKVVSMSSWLANHASSLS
jgi:hypothetical protein